MWDKFKDHFHFYLLLGIVPLTLITTYANIFIGQAQLTEIPEGYTPHYWEYFKVWEIFLYAKFSLGLLPPFAVSQHPVSRFIAKHILYDKSLDYETFVAKLTEESETVILKKIERELRAEMSEKADNKTWYYRGYKIEDYRFHSEFDNTANIRYWGYQDTGDLKD